MPQHAHLVRTIPVRVLDFSWSGCLVEADAAIAPGTAGELQIQMEGSQNQDPIQIVRQTEHGGARHSFTIGGRFMWGRRPDTTSVRSKVPSIVTIP